MSSFDSSSHDELPGDPEAFPGLQDAVPPQLPQSHVWHYDGLLEGGRAWSAHIRDPAVEAGGLLWPGRNLLRRRRPLLAHWAGWDIWNEGDKKPDSLLHWSKIKDSKHEHTLMFFLWSNKFRHSYRNSSHCSQMKGLKYLIIMW